MIKTIFIPKDEKNHVCCRIEVYINNRKVTTIFADESIEMKKYLEANGCEVYEQKK